MDGANQWIFPALCLYLLVFEECSQFWSNIKGSEWHTAPVAEMTVDTKLCSEAKQGPGSGERPWHVKCVQGRVFCLCFVQVVQSKYLEKDMMMLDTRWLRTPHPPILQETVFYSYLLVIMMKYSHRKVTQYAYCVQRWKSIENTWCSLWFSWFLFIRNAFYYINIREEMTY